MGQFSKVLLGIDQVHTVPQRALDCGPENCGEGAKPYSCPSPQPSMKQPNAHTSLQNVCCAGQREADTQQA